MNEQPSCENLENQSVQQVPLSIENYNQLLNIQQKIFSSLASHHKTHKILEELCSLAEALLSNSVASIMLVDNSGLMSVKAAPSVPEVGHKALENLRPGPGGGSCGNAVFRNEAQYVHNTFEDSRWQDLRHIAYDFNLCSCWSMPIKNQEGEAIGSFALSSFEHREPSTFHKMILETAASIISIVLRNQKNEQKIQLFSKAIENATEGMIITNAKNQIIETNEAFEKIYGYTNDEILNKNPKYFASGKHHDDFYRKMWNDLEKNNTWCGEITNLKKDGSSITQWMSVTAFFDENEKLQNYLAVFTDLTQLIQTQNRLEYMLYHDTLTSLYNKTCFEKIIEDKKERSLVVLNIDNFSYINTAYGFDVADNLLINIAKILEKESKANNIFKFNADEFVLLYDEEIDLEKKIKAIQNYFFANSIKIEDLKLNISFSYGAVYGNNNLLRNSSTALKLAKENGKNRFYIYKKDEDNFNYEHKEEIIKASNLVRNAIENDNIIPYFQGMYDNEKNEINKYEALVRIEKNEEVISPYYFLEAAQVSGLLPDITKIMIDKSFKTMQDEKVSFSVNITEDDLSQNYLNEYIKEKLKEYSIDAERLTLEILEGISSSGKKNHIKQLNALKNLGLKIAIDDFGTEYSNFERILDLDVDFIKIDAKYIKDIHINKRSFEITRALVFFAKNVNITCIAEFVHNEEVQKIIEDLKIEYSQGYFFSEPKKELIK